MKTMYEIYDRNAQDPTKRIRNIEKEGLAFHAYRTYRDSGRDVRMVQRITGPDPVKNGMWLWMDVEPNTGWWNEIRDLRWILK